MAIPKIIHYCWLSGEAFPDDIQRCIDSWKKCLPDYKIKLWDTHNFDCSKWKYTQQALAKRKYAFVSDVVRLYALYTEGGIYLDSDIEVLRNFNDLLDNPAFSGIESGGRFAAWIMASEAGNPLFKRMLSYYDNRNFITDQGKMDLTPNTIPMTAILSQYGMKPENTLQRLEHITIYPEEYFCPKNPWTLKINITKNTRAMHLFAGAWNDTAASDLEFFGRISEFVDKFVKKVKRENLSQLPVNIFGTGTVGTLVLENMNLRKISIKNFIVTKRDNGWNEISGIPIIELTEADDFLKYGIVIIATLPKLHEEIDNSLKRNGFRHIYNIGSTDFVDL